MNKLNFRILIIGNKDRFIHLEQFALELKKRGVETKIIHDLDYIDKYFELNFRKKIQKKKKFEKILQDFGPNIVLLDRITKIGRKVLENNIPIFILFRGNYWEEKKWAEKTIYKSKKQKIAVQKNEELVDYCLKNASLILPISKYLEKEVNKRYPGKNIDFFPADGRKLDDWNRVPVQKLKHPCVGLVQGLNVWGKTRELLTLRDVLKKLPDVTFYLAGDGIYRDEIILELEKFDNFVWMKNIDYPIEIKKFFSEIDIFLLLSGLEGLGQTIIEASLMKKPIIASNVGGIPELIQDGENGLLVENGDANKITEYIMKLINDPNFSETIAKTGYERIKQDFSWDKIAEKFELILKKHNFLKDN